MSRILRKTAFCVCENKDADQLRGNREADQRLCFRYIDSTILLPPIHKISSLWPHCVVVQPGLCRTWSETPKTGFLTTRLKLFHNIYRPMLYAVMILSFRTNRSGQTVQTQIRLLLEEQFDQGLHCLLFHLHLFDEIPKGLAPLFQL